MNNAYGLTAENILSSLPSVLAEDKEMQALGSAIADVLSSRVREIDTLSIYPHIDEMPEELLDILAYDFKVDWWDYGYSLDEKRSTMKKSWYVHKHMGTPASVKAALSAFYPGTILEEWWQYNGAPYHFRIKIPIDQSSIDPVKHNIVMGLVRFYKNLRSVLDSVEYYGSSGSTTYYPLSATIGMEIRSTAIAKPTTADFITDENDNFLLDEMNNYLSN